MYYFTIRAKDLPTFVQTKVSLKINVVSRTTSFLFFNLIRLRRDFPQVFRSEELYKFLVTQTLPKKKGITQMYIQFFEITKCTQTELYELYKIFDFLDIQDVARLLLLYISPETPRPYVFIESIDNGLDI